MEIILDHDEVESLLREALAARGSPVPATCEMKIRNNHKKGTVRIVFADRPDGRGRKSHDG